MGGQVLFDYKCQKNLCKMPNSVLQSDRPFDHENYYNRQNDPLVIVGNDEKKGKIVTTRRKKAQETGMDFNRSNRVTLCARMYLSETI